MSKPLSIPCCYIIAGPNGSGKTTFATEFLPHYVNCLEFVNPDLIAKGLSPFSPDLALDRIADRVRDGGHDVPELDVRRRFPRTLKNLFGRYMPMLDSLNFYDNSGRVPRLVFAERNGERTIGDPVLFQQLCREVRL